MTNKSKTFDEFYYLITNDKCDVESVIDYADNHNGKIVEYEGKMFCPECKQAELYFVHKTSLRCAHLRRCPSARHNETCSYNHEYASEKQIQTYLSSFSSNQIQDKLNSMINMLCKPKRENTIDSISQNRVQENNPMLIQVDDNKKKTIKSLRRKKLNTRIEKTDINKLFVFYGKVKLKMVEKEKKEKKYYVLEVYNQTQQGKLEFRTSFYYEKKINNIDTDLFYYIAIIGFVREVLWQIKPINRNAIKFATI